MGAVTSGVSSSSIPGALGSQTVPSCTLLCDFQQSLVDTLSLTAGDTCGRVMSNLL
jgi:hypothetical protein